MCPTRRITVASSTYSTKIKALHERGIEVHLHCYKYGRSKAPELLRYCKSVTYYRRRTGWWSHLSFLPYIVYSRRSKALLRNLRANDYPILFEGLHTVHSLLRDRLAGRQLMLRSHNVEHQYYRYLARRESNIFRKLYYYKEAIQLESLLDTLPHDLSVAAISPADTAYWQRKFPNTFWLPPFHSSTEFTNRMGTGTYALYHGNLSVSENTEAAVGLIDQFAGGKVQLVVAGKEPTPALTEWVAKRKRVVLIADPDSATMDRLITEAQVILLPTHQPTGIKLKLLESLLRGRWCVANGMMVDGTRLEACVVVTEDNFYGATLQLMDRPFGEAALAVRRQVIGKYYNGAENVEKLLLGF